MEYLLDKFQSESASQVINEGIAPEVLEEKIEKLRGFYYQRRLGGQQSDIDLDSLARRAYMITTLVSGPYAPFQPQIVCKALSVAALIFEYLSEVAHGPGECVNHAINAILFYSRGEQEAQSATLAKKLYRGLTAEICIFKNVDFTEQEATI